MKDILWTETSSSHTLTFCERDDQIHMQVPDVFKTWMAVHCSLNINLRTCFLISICQDMSRTFIYNLVRLFDKNGCKHNTDLNKVKTVNQQQEILYQLKLRHFMKTVAHILLSTFDYMRFSNHCKLICYQKLK